MAELEGGFVNQSAAAIGGALTVFFPAIRYFGKLLLPGEALHDAQLHYVQPMVKRTRDHRQARSGLLVKRPETEVIAVQSMQQGLDTS